MINVIQQPNNYQTDSEVWWLIYDPSDSLITLGPLQCSGTTGSPLVMVVASTKEEIDSYIQEKSLLTEPAQDSNSYYTDEHTAS